MIIRRSLFLFCLFVTSCATIELPQDFDRTESHALEPINDGRLTGYRPIPDIKLQKSGYFLLDKNLGALKWRLALIDTAQRSLDLQYYVWKDDLSGELLAYRLMLAADRGVRVRLLVDDFLVANDWRIASGAAQHPNIEVRLFNPWAHRGPLNLRRISEWIQRAELNFRMHNKLLVADGRVAIVGGRNIADEYFGLSAKSNFADLDLATIGPVVQELSATFDDFWNYDWSFPAEVLAPDVEHLDEAALFYDVIDDTLTSATLKEIGLTPAPDWGNFLSKQWDKFVFGAVVAVSDHPEEIGADSGRVIRSIIDIIQPAVEEVTIVSAYFVPTVELMELYQELTNRGVRVRVLTNSLASNNHTIAHSQYRKWRLRLLNSGVQLYEMRHDREDVAHINTAPFDPDHFVLHTKTVIVDRQHLYLGALNLSPRGKHINTENGILISDPNVEAMLAQLDDEFEPQNAWKLSVDDQSNITWTSLAGITRKQPAKGSLQRVADWFYGLFDLAHQI